MGMNAQIKDIVANMDPKDRAMVARASQTVIEKAEDLKAGIFEPLGFFDPLGISTNKAPGKLLFFREAELKHGRVCMLASLGFLVQESFHPLFTADGGPAIEQIPKLPPALWFGMTLGIGICEAIRIQAGWANPFEGEKPWSLKPGY